jgi:hypothetical protein
MCNFKLKNICKVVNIAKTLRNMNEVLFLLVQNGKTINNALIINI